MFAKLTEVTFKNKRRLYKSNKHSNARDRSFYTVRVFSRGEVEDDSIASCYTCAYQTKSD
ncbi:hypothetical protein GCM10011350_31880 [Marinomonas arctica]|nr:hypothetical protein GCM10011350_31880 [Marinomonas arctica]